MNRREFLARSAAVATLGAAAAACGDGVLSGVAPVVLPPGNPPPTMDVQVMVSDFAALATEGVLVKVSTFYAAKRTGPESFDAFSMACTHEGCLTDITNGQRFDCPCHFSRFDSDGNVINGPATRPLQKLPTVYDPDTDTLTIN